MDARDQDGRLYPPVRKSLGQHFLTDRRILERIAGALDLTGAETVVEIGIWSWGAHGCAGGAGESTRGDRV